MKKNEILLSTGCIIWHGLKDSISYAKDIGYDGIEIVPSRNIVSEIKNTIGNNNVQKYIQKLNSIRSVHQNWRLDIGFDRSYRIKFSLSILLTVLRFVLFPKIKESNKIIRLLSKYLNCPITVHGLSGKWTKDNAKKEFTEILFEIIGASTSPKQLKNWLKNDYHNIVIDSRDDQSLSWAKKYGLNTWKTFWKWLNIKKIKGYQLTFIGIHGLKKIFNHEKSLAEEQLLWLHKNKWMGHVTVEINPLMLFLIYKGNLKEGLKVINQFIRRTLIRGEKWSI